MQGGHLHLIRGTIQRPARFFHHSPFSWLLSTKPLHPSSQGSPCTRPSEFPPPSSPLFVAVLRAQRMPDSGKGARAWRKAGNVPEPAGASFPGNK